MPLLGSQCGTSSTWHGKRHQIFELQSLELSSDFNRFYSLHIFWQQAARIINSQSPFKPAQHSTQSVNAHTYTPIFSVSSTLFIFSDAGIAVTLLSAAFGFWAAPSQTLNLFMGCLSDDVMWVRTQRLGFSVEMDRINHPRDFFRGDILTPHNWVQKQL